MTTGYKTRKKRLRGTGVRHPTVAKPGPPSHKGESAGRTRRTCDVWYTPTLADVYAQVKVAETMLSRTTDPNLAVVKREMYILEDTMWQLGGQGLESGE